MSNSNADDEVLGLMQLISESKYSDDKYNNEQQLYKNFTNELRNAHERGEDISEYVWPPEWNLKKRPKQHHAENIISLADAIDICGKKIYGSLWQDFDWYARSDDEIEKWNPAHHTYLAFSFSEKTQFANFNDDEDSEKQAYKRKGDVFSKLSAWLNQGKVNAFNIETDGSKNDISQNTWLSSDAIQILNSGKTCNKEEGAFRANENYVYLDKIQFMDVLQKEITEYPKDKINLSPEKIVCTDQIIEDFYIPEYLKLMLAGVQALGLSQDKRADIDTIKDWLNENWPNNLEGKSDRLIKYMATLMRRPEDKKGGNQPWKNP